MKTEYSKAGTSIKYYLITIALVSCSMLMYEVLLTRICSLQFEYHFGFLIVSNCLLGIGASGSMIFLKQKLFAENIRKWSWIFTVLYMISLLLTYPFLIAFNVIIDVSFQFPAFILKFMIFNIIATVPFFFAGSVIGLILTFNAAQINKVYFFNLFGAGLGCLFCPFFLWTTGAGGCFIFLTFLAIISIMVMALPAFKRKVILTGTILGLVALLLLPKFDNWFPVPSKIEIGIAKDYRVNIRENIFYSRWSPTSRVDLVNIMQDQRILLGVNVHKPLPEEKFILQDGQAGTFILNFSENPDSLKILSQSLYSLAFMLKKYPRVFIIGVGGGNDVWAAKLNGAQYIKGIELNRQILDIHKNVLASYSKNIIDDPNIDLVFDEGRSALIRDTTSYDVIQMTGVDTLTSLASGAYVLAENYLYTTEALKNMYSKLTDGGIISVMFAQHDVASLRFLANIFAALENAADRSTKLENSIVCIEAGFLRTILIKKGEFTVDELEKLERVSIENGFKILYFPGRIMGNILEKFIQSNEKPQFIRSYTRDISSTSDNRPYFFNFTKWDDLLRSGKYLVEPITFSQGNPMFIFGQLTISTLLSVIFIVLPLVVLRKNQINRLYLKRFFLYFMGLGLGFIFIEIVLIQKLVLFLGHPIYSLTVTIFSMLIFTGIGSLLSGRWFHSPTARAWIVPTGLSVFLGLFIWLSPGMVQSLIIWPRTARILLTVLILAPIGLLLGVPFAYGIQLLNRFNPSIIPWAWAANGCLTVIGSILAVILSMNVGFNAVLFSAILVYWLSFLSIYNIRYGNR